MRWLAVVVLLATGCRAPISEIPFEPGKCHYVSKMTPVERQQSMAWKHWKHQPTDALYDPDHKPGLGDSGFNEKDKPGRLYCPKGMILSWDLNKIGTPPAYLDAQWTAHCYRVSVDL